MGKHLGIVLLSFFCLFSCNRLDNIDKRLDTLESRVSSLEKQYNTDISSLQTAVAALQANKYVTSVSPIKEGEDVVGYTINLSDGSSFPVYHGKKGDQGDKGDKGDTGKDGSTPVIGILQHTDGNWYWTVNGEFMTDASGNKIVAVAKDGKDGKDGITPQLKIEDKYWMVSCDGGKTWETLSKAVGEDGKDGRTLFSGIDTATSEEYVILTLINGETIKLPTWYAFEKLEQRISTLNEELSALQKIVDGITAGDYITDVYEIDKDGRKGFAFVFHDYGTVEIFNGKDGEKGDKGETGEDGDTPSISVASEDGVWYWTLNGEWLLDTDGNKVRTSGKDGKDGITPQLKIEENIWLLSYDNGENWIEAGPSKGKDGKTIFTDVDTSDESKVVFTLYDGSTVSVPTQTAFSALEDMCNRLNTNLESLKTIVEAIQERDYVTSVTTLYDGEEIKGYKLAFFKAGEITIYNGVDGSVPTISAKAASDGKYYWTVNGEWLMVSGAKVPTTGSDGKDGYTPQLKVSSGGWYIKATESSSWEYVTQATGSDGKDGESLFSSIEVTDTDVTFTLASDGTSFTLNRKLALSINFDETAMSQITPSTTREFPYTVVSASENIKVEVLTSGDLKAKVIVTNSHTGIIRVQTGPSFDEYSKISVIVTDGDQLVIRTVSFSLAPFAVESSLYCGASGKGGEIDFNFLSSVNFNVSISEESSSWVSLVSTRVLTEHGVTLSLGENPGYGRTAEIKVSSTADPSTSFTFFVVQEDAPYLKPQRDAVRAMYNSLEGRNWTRSDNWDTLNGAFEDMYGVTCDAMHNITSISLPANNLCGTLPEELGNLDHLKRLHLQNNNITGSLPASLSTIFQNHRDDYLDYRFFGNRLSGDIPDPLLTDPKFPSMAGMLIEDQQDGYGFTLADLRAVGETYDALTSGTIDLSSVYSSHSYTLLFRWGEWSTEALELVKDIAEYKKQYEQMGLAVVGAYAGGDPTELEKYFQTSPMSGWTHFRECCGNGSYDPEKDYPVLWESSEGYEVPFIEVVDQSGNIVFVSDDEGKYSSYSAARPVSSLDSLLNALFKGQHYYSTDFSRDGNVSVIQKAKKGQGINLVLMGDAFSDRLIENGSYAKLMNRAAEYFFSIEPYTSFRDMFNVYSVDVVSTNDEYFSGSSTALNTYFSTGTRVGGTDTKVTAYALNAVTGSDLSNTIIIVLMNREYYAGTCYLYKTDVEGHTYAEGTSIAYLPLGTDSSGQKSLSALIHHEVGGHGFAKLGDEYYYESAGQIPSSQISTYKTRMKFGWYKNLDFTSDRTEVKWSSFLTDPLYTEESIGVFEGGFTYSKGVWRSTEYSIMRSNQGGFNAPSREAIYYKIHKLAYGDDWQYDRNEFIVWDLTVKATSSDAPSSRSIVGDTDFTPLAPPVIVDKKLL